MEKMRFLMILSMSAFFMASTVFAAFDTSVNLIEYNPDFEDGGNDWNTGGGQIIDTDNGPSLPECTSCSNPPVVNTCPDDSYATQAREIGWGENNPAPNSSR